MYIYIYIYIYIYMEKVLLQIDEVSALHLPNNECCREGNYALY